MILFIWRVTIVIITTIGGRILGRAEIKTRTKELMRISLPMAIEHVSVSVMGMVSTMLISYVSEAATSALGMVDSITHLILALFAALTTGGTIVVAQYIGRDDRRSAKRAGGQAVMLSVVFSLVMFVVILVFRDSILNALFGNAEQDVMDAARTFLTIINFSYPVVAVTLTMFGLIRGAGDTFAPMIISVIMNVINLILGFILIQGLDLGFVTIPSFGIYGAAWSLVAAKVFGLLASTWYIVKRARGIRLNKIKYFLPDFKRQKAILRFGLPTSFESGLFQAGRLITAVIIVSMSTAAIATNTIGFSIMNFVNVPGMAFSTGAMILIGQRIGRGKEDDVVRTSLFSMVVCGIFFAALGVVLIIFRNPIFALFNPSPETMEYLPIVFVTYIVLAPFLWPSSFALPAALRATGDVVYPMVVSISTMILVRLLFAYILGIVFGMGIIGVWVAMYLDWVARSAFFYPRLLRGKWKGKAVTSEE
ncbi:MAG: MATE family efflux transporter [Defluviitaleaceae bacterium]|nr:MATE family efflux transporter [Defluviitaleaceae bacterium]